MEIIMAKTIPVKRFWNKYDDNTQELPEVVPSVVFKTRVRDESIVGDNPYRWENKTSFDPLLPLVQLTNFQDSKKSLPSLRLLASMTFIVSL